MSAVSGSMFFDPYSRASRCFQSPPKPVNVGLEVRRDRLIDDGRVKPLKVTCDGKLDAFIEASLAKTLSWLFFHNAATQAGPEGHGAQVAPSG